MEDKQILEAIKLEEKRQKNHIELIASENYVSKDVLTATGSVLTNKYAEGYPGKRYYNGTKYVDIIENLARERLKKLFNVKYVNVQPHSGSQANAAAFAALIKPGEKIMGLSLKSGGHLSHGYKISFSGTFYKSVNYDVDKDGFLNYKQILNIAKKEKPNLIIAGYSAYSKLIDFKKFKKIAKAVNAYLLVDMAHIAGLIAGKAISSPVKYADVITSTTQKTLRGARGGIIMTNNKDLAKKIDMSVFPGQQGGPLMHSIAGKAVTFFEALKPSFKQYAKQIIKNAKAFSNTFKKLGCKIVAGGTDTHLFTIDVKSSYKITGLDASTYLQKNNITVNKNTIPFDSESPFVTSGIRLGTAAMTSRGFKEKEFIELAKIIDEILKNPDVLVKDKVNKLIKNFPIKDKY